MEQTLCPKCGAYWECDCVIEPPPELAMTVDSSCEHDWLEAVGVELFIDLDSPDAHVVVCRFCGAYTISESGER